MNNEEKILDILVQMQQEQRVLSNRLTTLEVHVSELKIGQAKLQADITDIKVNQNGLWDEVARFSKRLNEHEVVLQNRIV